MSEELTVTDFLSYAQMALQSQSYINCVNLSDGALKRDPNNAVALTYKGTSLYNLGSYEQAEAALKQAIQMKPAELGPRYFYALTLDAIRETKPERIAETQRAYEEFLGLVPVETQTPDIEQAVLMATNNLGLVYLQQGRFEEALACINKIFEKFPESPSVAYNRIAILLKMEDFENAEPAIRSALCLKSDFYDVEYAQVELFRQTGRETLASAFALALMPRVEMAGRYDIANKLRGKFPSIDASASSSVQFAYEA